jgi:protein subunit release factor B
MTLPQQIVDRLLSLGASPGEVEERFVRGSGPGGQKINKTSSTVVLVHRPSGLEVRIQRERSQAANRELAWTELCNRLEARRDLALQRALSEKELQRRRNRQKSPGQKRRMVESKRRQAGRKSARGKVRDDG